MPLHETLYIPLSAVSTGAGPAQAGIHGSLVGSGVCYRSDVWIPAFAGKTKRAHRHDRGGVLQNDSFAQRTVTVQTGGFEPREAVKR